MRGNKIKEDTTPKNQLVRKDPEVVDLDIDELLNDEINVEEPELDELELDEMEFEDWEKESTPKVSLKEKLAAKAALLKGVVQEKTAAVTSTVKDIVKKDNAEEATVVRRTVEQEPIEDTIVVRKAPEQAPIEDTIVVRKAAKKEPVEGTVFVDDAAEQAPIEDTIVVKKSTKKKSAAKAATVAGAVTEVTAAEAAAAEGASANVTPAPDKTVKGTAAEETAASDLGDQKMASDAEETMSDTKKETTTKEGSEKAESKKTEIEEPAFMRKVIEPEEGGGAARPIKWGLILPALVVVLCLVMFVVASYAGWIQSFLTPESKRLMKETTTEETTPVPETTTEKETTTEEPTTEETTTEFIPSYYVIYVNLAYNRVTVYERGEKLNDGADPEDPLDDEYDLIPHIAFTCSPGLDGATPTGTFYLQNRAAWCEMIHDVYTQYATRIVDDVMFHSIPYFSENPGDLSTYDYNILGQDASSACIRLNVRDAYWIFNYCAEDTEVQIFYDWSYDGPIAPEPIYDIPENWGDLSKWDPTDIYSPGNPWNSYEAYLYSSDVTVPCYSSVNRLLQALAPSDNYGNSVAGFFYTDGNYNLDVPGTYYPMGYITVANKTFSFQLSITVTEDIADEYYNDGIYEGDDDWDDWDDDGWDDYEDYDDGWDDEYSDEEDEYSDEDTDEYSDDGDEYSEDEYSEDDYSEDEYMEEGEYYEDDYAANEGSEEEYSGEEDNYSEDGGDYSEDGGDYSEEDYGEDEYY